MKAVEAFGMAVAVIGCVATVIMVPEVRCAFGMDSAMQCTDASGVEILIPPGTATLTAVPREDARIHPIRQRYKWIENSSSRLQEYAPVPLDWGGADSASAIVYTDRDGIAKITARVYSGDQRNVLKFYYDNASLVFVYQVQQTLYPVRNAYEQRFYFGGGRMFRWLDPEKRVVDERSPDFERNSRLLGEIGAELPRLTSELLRMRG